MKIQVKDFPVQQMFFKKGSEEGSITKSEMFLLFTEIQKAQLTKTTFEKKYTLNFWSDRSSNTIYTDGRYYSLPSRPGEVFDLGYNFFERNSLDARLKPIEE